MASENLPVIPPLVWFYILSHLEEANDLARASAACRCFREGCDSVQSIRVTVTNKDHEYARNQINFTPEPASSSELDSRVCSKLLTSCSTSKFQNLKKKVLHLTSMRKFMLQLRIEVEPELQSKSVADTERLRTDFWFSEPYFVKELCQGIGSTLQHLCIVDYAQQGLMRRSTIFMVLSKECPLMTTVELRNMYLDTSKCGEMHAMRKLTLRCVKVVSRALYDINLYMPNLETLALLGVYGVEGGDLKFYKMKVLCLGLSSPVKSILMRLPMLEKLQLKMQCPEDLKIWAISLRCVAFNVEVPANSSVQINCDELNGGSFQGLIELLYGATSFKSFGELVRGSLWTLKKIYIDIPCMALDEDGKFVKVLEKVPLTLPTFSELHRCQLIEVLNIGPGLWHSMERKVDEVISINLWPKMKFLIIHIILIDAAASTAALQPLLGPSVRNLTIRIHTHSPGNAELFTSNVEQLVRQRYGGQLSCNFEQWTKNLSFTHFSF